MRLFHGDGPAVQLEAGNQKGGHYFCPTCDLFLYQTDSISHTYQLKQRSFIDKQNKILKGYYGQENSKKRMLPPLQSLTTKQLQKELSSRGINTSSTTKLELEPLLKKELEGQKRVPIILKNDPVNGVENLNLTKYELASVEPMHDIGGHFANVFEELPHHLSSIKEIKRNCDRRKSLLEVTVKLCGNINNKVICLLKTLIEIQRILYLNEAGWTPQEVLRLHYSCFQHFVWLKEVIGFNLKKITREKLYGKYLHNLLVHAPMQYRMINGQSINCEAEERYFNAIKKISNNTTNFRPGKIIGNLIIRQQIEARVKNTYFTQSTKTTVNSEIDKLNKIIEKSQYNTFFTYEFIKNNPADWQAHLERISVFLVIGEGVWWKKTEFGVEFLDKYDLPHSPTKPAAVLHFRSSDMVKTFSTKLGTYHKPRYCHSNQSYHN